MTSKSDIWTGAQKLEKSYYQSRVNSLADEARSIPYADIHSAFWRGILKLLPELPLLPGGYYCDVGCGPNSILTFVEHGTKIGVDPLMNFYKSNFNLPPDIRFSKDRIEFLESIEDGKADVIFVMNCIDHVEDVGLASKTLSRKMKPGGYLVISVNIVQNRLVHLLSQVIHIYRFIDPTHPHHYSSPRDLSNVFQHSFDLVRSRNIQHLVVELIRTKEMYNKSAPPTVSNESRFKGLVRKAVALREDLHLLLLRKRDS